MEINLDNIKSSPGKINDSDIIHINDSVHKHYLVFGKIGVCNSKQEN